MTTFLVVPKKKKKGFQNVFGKKTILLLYID